jgi:hypothetical protein
MREQGKDVPQEQSVNVPEIRPIGMTGEYVHG